MHIIIYLYIRDQHSIPNYIVESNFKRKEKISRVRENQWLWNILENLC